MDFFYNDPEAAKAYRQDIEPAIVHFTSHIKPWNEPKREFADKFWYYARQTPFYEEILFRSIAKQKLGIDYTEIAAATNRKDCLSLLRRYKFIAFFGLGSTRKNINKRSKRSSSSCETPQHYAACKSKARLNDGAFLVFGRST